jgi:hypothetical protein
MELDSEMDDFMVSCMEHAKQTLLDEGEIEFMAFFRPNIEPDLPKEMNPDGKDAMGCIPMCMAPNKDVWYQMIGQAVKQMGAKFVVIVVDAWVSINPEPNKDGEYLMPSADPNKLDALCVNGIEYDTAGFILRNKRMTTPYEKKNNKYVFLEHMMNDLSSEDDNTDMFSILADITARYDLA